MTSCRLAATYIQSRSCLSWGSIMGYNPEWKLSRKFQPTDVDAFSRMIRAREKYIRLRSEDHEAYLSTSTEQATHIEAIELQSLIRRSPSLKDRPDDEIAHENFLETLRAVFDYYPQELIAKELGVTNSTIGRWKTGELLPPRAPTRRAMVDTMLKMLDRVASPPEPASVPRPRSKR